MDNRPSCSRENTDIGSAGQVHVEPHIDKSTRMTHIESAEQVHIESHMHFHAAPDPEGPTREPEEEMISCCKKVTSGVKHCDEFKRKLQQFYKKLTLPKVAWIEEGADLSLVDHFIQLKLEESKEKLEESEEKVGKLKEEKVGKSKEELEEWKAKLKEWDKKLEECSKELIEWGAKLEKGNEILEALGLDTLKRSKKLMEWENELDESEEELEESEEELEESEEELKKMEEKLKKTENLFDKWEVPLRQWEASLRKQVPELGESKEKLEELREELEELKKELEELKEDKKTLEEMFQPVNDRRPTRILIEGQPGFGKTTLAMKLAHDWATGKSYVKFKFVFLVPLRDLQERSMEDAILEIGKRCGFHNNMQIFNFHMKDTLLILDGFDELSQEARTEINKILYKQLYSDVTVILFCRTDSFEVTHKERRQLFGLTNMQGIFYDKKITSLGVKSERKKRNFLEKFLPKSRVENLVKCLFPVLSISTKSKQWELFNSPLLLMLLSIIMQQDETIEGIATRTQFYKQLFNCILKHSFRKRGHEIDSDFDLFDLDSSPNAIQQSMKQFGIVSLRNIIEYNLQFESNELTDEINELGFLIKHRELTFISSRNHYEGLHQSFLEFAAAFGLWLNLKFKTAASVESDLKLIVYHHLDNRKTSLVLRFLVSLMEGELDLLLSQIESFSMWFNLDFDMTVELLSDCQSNHFSKTKCLRKFIPHDIDVRYNYQCKRKLLELLEYGSECGQIETIAINEATDSEIFTIKIAPRCQIKKVLFFHEDMFTVYGSFDHFRTIPGDVSMDKLLHFAASTNSEIDVYISSKYDPQFRSLIVKEKVLSQIKFRYLRIKIDEKFEDNVVIQLLQNDQVAHLHLSNYKDIQFDMSDICNAAAKSIQLTCISLDNFTIDLYDLTAAGTKTYTFISLEDCSLTCRHSLLFKHCCNDLEIRHIRHVKEFPAYAKQIHITRGCDEKMLSYFVAKCSESANNIPAISIDFFDYYTNTGKYLQTLIIHDIKSNVDNKMLATCIFKLPIINLVVYVDDHMQTLFEHMNNLWAVNNNSRLKTILLDNLSMFVEKCVVKDLIEGLKCNHWQQVHLNGDKEILSDVREYLESSNLRVTPGNLDLICAEFHIIMDAPFKWWTCVPFNKTLSISR